MIGLLLTSARLELPTQFGQLAEYVSHTFAPLTAQRGEIRIPLVEPATHLNLETVPLVVGLRVNPKQPQRLTADLSAEDERRAEFDVALCQIWTVAALDGDYAHLAIAFCRCMNFPARYCTGYLGDIGVPPSQDPMDFSAWVDVYLGGRWYTFDARNNVPRIGRVLIARGRDAADVAISSTFGPNTLKSFKVWTDEVNGAGR